MANLIRYDDQMGFFNLATAGNSPMTVQAYRDTSFLIEHCRHDQDDVIGYFKFQFGHKKKRDTPITSVHVHCIPCGTNPATAKNVRFSWAYTWQNSGGVFPANASWISGTSDMPISTTGQYTGLIHSFSVNLTPPSPEHYSSWLLFRVLRLSSSGSDTYVQSNPSGTAAANLAILGVDCHIQFDGRDGSINEIDD